VLNTALRQCRAWQDAGLTVPISVNLSANNLRETDLPDRLRGLLETWGVAPDQLILEITENELVVQSPETVRVLERLRSLGVGIAIDDFGSGHAALGYLRRLPVNVLKIDKSFVMQMRASEPDAAIIRSAIHLAHDLNLEVVAEGVEDRETLNVLAGLGCDLVQGYYLSRPLLPEALEQWARTSSWGLGGVHAPPERQPNDLAA
jgi:EAL domain-containing protein (putative c-di-GMP-specific phosphodiesterase class I)